MNNLNIEQRIVCYIDILSFSDIIAKFEETQNPTIIEKIRNAFDNALADIHDFKNPSKEIGEITDNYIKSKTNTNQEKIDELRKDISFQTFSDNVIITISFIKDSKVSFLYRLPILIILSNLFQYNMMSNGVYTRGGISFGSFYSDGNIIFSNALIKAYKIESKIAVYPRIVIDEDIIEIIKNCAEEKIIRIGLDELIYFDWENIAFLSPFMPYDTTAKDIEELINAPDFSNNPKVKELQEKGIDIPQPYQHLLQQYEKIVSDVRTKSNDISYSNAIRSKYLWLIEFHKWKYLKGDTKLNFSLLADMMSK